MIGWWTLFCLLGTLNSSWCLEIQIAEEVTIGTEIADLRTSISKEGQLLDIQLVTFKTLSSDDFSNGLVEVTPEGRLFVSRRIDREELCPPFGISMMPSLTDGSRRFNPLLRHSLLSISSFGEDVCAFTVKIAIQQKSVAAELSMEGSTDNVRHVRIIVLDVNDNAPFWPENLQRQVIEFRDGDQAGKQQSLPMATDLDQGENGRITYSLDCEHQTETSLRGRNEGNCEDMSSIPFQLARDPADRIYLQATREIDHETASSYKLILRAVDSVDKTRLDDLRKNIGPLWPNHLDRYLRPHTASISLTVVIQDINDNDPKFTQPVFTPDRQIPETTPVESIILRLKATDADSGSNGAFRFSFAYNAGWPSVDALAQQLFDVRANGDVVVRSSLDVDRQWRVVESLTNNAGLEGGVGRNRHYPSVGGKPKTMEFRFKVLVEDDAGSYARSSEALVHIIVVDENDEAPQIEAIRSQSNECIASLGRVNFRAGDGNNAAHSSYACVFENSPLDTVVATVQVSDLDFGGEDEFDCTLTNNNFTLLSEEFANTRLTANQIKKNFNRPYGKTKTARMVQYAVLTARNLDREVTPFQRLQVICEDLERHQTLHNMTIFIGDVNDNKPHFTNETLYYQVAENAPVRTVLKPMNASNTVAIASGLRGALAIDEDVGRNGNLKYSLVEGSEEATNFSVDPFTGALSTRMSFDREINERFTFMIMATDQGSHSLVGTGTVEVLIMDVNDNAPKFIQESYSFQIPENIARASIVGQVSAIDADDVKIQGPVSYHLSHDHDAIAFSIDRMTGEITTRRSLDREEQPNYTFKVLARDSSVGTLRLTATATITVILEDVNDNSPVFITPNSTANTLTVAVSQTLGHRLVVIAAEDADEGENGRVTYRIKAGNNLNLFNIDAQTGLLFLGESLGRLAELHQKPENETTETEESAIRVRQLSTQPTIHVLTLEACDCGVESRCTVSTNLRIHVQPGSSSMIGKEDGRRYYADQHQFTLIDNNNNPGGEGVVGVGTAEVQKGVWNGGMQARNSRNRGGLFLGGSSETVIICMSVLFVILLIAILALALLVRNCKLGLVKPLPSSANQRSLSRSKSPTYTNTLRRTDGGIMTEMTLSPSLHSSGMILGPPQSQSEMHLSGVDGLRRVVGCPGGISSSQSFFEMPKSIHEFSCQAFSPTGNVASSGGGDELRNNATGFSQTTIGKKHDMTNSTNVLYPAKYSRIPDSKDGTLTGQPIEKVFASHPYAARNNAMFYGEYQALRGNGFYGLNGSNEKPDLFFQQHQQAQLTSQNPMHQKVFGSNFTCVPRYLVSGGNRASSMVNNQSYQMQRVTDDDQIISSPTSGDVAFNTYGGYAGLKNNARTNDQNNQILGAINPNTERRYFNPDHHQQQHLMYAQDFPRSKSMHTIGFGPSGWTRQQDGSLTIAGMDVESGPTRDPGGGEQEDPFNSSMSDPNLVEVESMALLLLPENEDKSVFRDTLPTGKMSDKLQTSSTIDLFSRPNKLAASAFREASFV